MGITHVIRGDDHLTNTARQLLVLRALGAPPPRYAHHGMILDPEGGKLSKRHGATSVGEFRELGYLPQALVNYLALLSWSHGEEEILDRERLVAEFELERLSPSAAAFDLGKLDWLAHEHVMRLDPGEHARRFVARLPAGTPLQAAAALAAAAQPSLSAYGEAPVFAAAVLDAPVLDAAAVELVAGAREQLEHFLGVRAAAPEWLDPSAARDLLAAFREWGAAHELSAKRLLMPLRVALTGREHGPELHYVLAALARPTALDRLREALERAAAGLPPGSPRPGGAVTASGQDAAADPPSTSDSPSTSDPSSSAKGARP
jgi:glutamyl/glutaminyl-tRNA synthetase